MATKDSQLVAASHIKSHWIHRLHSAVPNQGTFFIAPSSEVLAQLPVLFTYICVEKQIILITLSVREKSLREIKELLESSFLGQSNWYGIWDLELAPKNILPQLLDYFMQYQGPHILIVCFSAEFSLLSTELKKASITLPTELSSHQCAELCASLPSRLFNQNTLRLIAQGDTQHVSLMHILATMRYVPVLGRALIPLFKEQYLPRIVKSEAGSLFAFTDFFWQKKASAFYAHWAHIKDFYSPQFWLAFWSDQFFRALCYTNCMRHKESALAQQIAARKLSFFYIKTGWQSVNDELLVTLHDMIYRIDHTSKTGGSTDMLEYIYQRWFIYFR